jgi:hypothetical protein
MALFRLLEQRCGLFAGCGVGRCAQVVESRFGYPITCFCGRIELLNAKPQQVIEGGTGERMVLSPMRSQQRCLHSEFWLCELRQKSCPNVSVVFQEACKTHNIVTQRELHTPRDRAILFFH